MHRTLTAWQNDTFVWLRPRLFSAYKSRCRCLSHAFLSSPLSCHRKSYSAIVGHIFRLLEAPEQKGKKSRKMNSKKGPVWHKRGRGLLCMGSKNGRVFSKSFFDGTEKTSEKCSKKRSKNSSWNTLLPRAEWPNLMIFPKINILRETLVQVLIWKEFKLAIHFSFNSVAKRG
jgi:hypothetical protein